MRHLLIFFLIGLLITNLSASIEEIQKDYSDIAIVYVNEDKLIEQLIVIAGQKFSLKNIDKDPLGHAVKHPALIKKDQIYLLLAGSKRDGIPAKQIICFKQKIINAEVYGEINLEEFLKLKKNQ